MLQKLKEYEYNADAPYNEYGSKFPSITNSYKKSLKKTKAKQQEKMKRVNKLKQEIKRFQTYICLLTEAFKLKIEPDEMNRKQFRKIMIRIGCPISYTQANEAFLEARGIDLEQSTAFDFDALVNWIIELSNHRKSDKSLELPKTKNFHIQSQDIIKNYITKVKLLRSDGRNTSKSSLNSSSIVDSKDLKLHKFNLLKDSNKRYETHDNDDLSSDITNSGVNSQISSQKHLSLVKNNGFLNKISTRIFDKFKKVLPDPNHPWKDPLKNGKYKWFELIDDTDEESDDPK